MTVGVTPPKRYEEYAFVLDFLPQGKSIVIRGREGPIVQALGEEHLTLLEIMGLTNATFDVGERVTIGKEGRTKVVSVLGKLNYEELTNEACDELPNVVEGLVRAHEPAFVSYFNTLQPLTPRLHALELIPGIGKTFMRQILDQRDRKPFQSFEEITQRVGLREPAKLLARRIIEEIQGGSRIMLFIRR